MTGYAYCTLCNRNIDVNYEHETWKTVEETWIVPLKCGHFFDWNTGKCYVDSYVQPIKPFVDMWGNQIG